MAKAEKEHSPMIADDDYAERTIRGYFEETIKDQIARYVRTKAHSVIPDAFFSAASAECRDMFVAGSFYGCISLAQAVGEALSKFVAEKNKVRLRKDYGTRVARLREAGVISSACKTAFQSLHGKDRDDYHHLNKNVEQDCRKLEARAEGCLAALHSIESEVFQFERKERAILPRFPQYWPKSGPHLSVYLKCT